MPNDYKKRAKGSWNVGKGCKDDSSERVYAKNEIKQELKAEETGLTRHKAKRKKNQKAHLEYWIEWYTQKVEELDRGKNKNTTTAYYFRSALEKKKEKLKKLLEDKK
jgi:hypothetical protein